MSTSVISHRLRRLLAEWLFLGMALLALGGFIAYSLYQTHRRIGADEAQQLTAQAKVVDDNLGRQLNAVNLALISIRDELPYWRGRQDGEERANRWLKSMNDAMPGVRNLLVLDAAGNVIATGRKEIFGKNFRDREYFQTAKRDPNPDLLYVGPPFRTILGAFVIPVSRMVAGKGERFSGIVNATLDPEEFSVLLESVRYAGDMRVALIHGDGKLYLTEPEMKDALGQNLAKPGSPFTRHQESGRAISLLTGDNFDGAGQSMIVLRTVQPAQLLMDKPLVVAISRNLTALYAGWRREVYVQSSMFILLVLIASPGLYFYQRRQRTFDRLMTISLARQKESAERLKLATEAARVGVWEYELASRRLTWDKTMLAIYGYDPATVTPTYELWENSLLPEDKAASEAALQVAIQTRGRYDENFHIRRRDGEVRVIHSRAEVYCDDAGQAVKVVGINEDITERKLAEQDLRIAATAFETRDGIMVTGLDSVILRVNLAFTRLTGYGAEEAVGKTPAILRSGRQDQEFYRQMWVVLLRDRYWEGEIWNRRKNGEIFPEWLTISAVPGPDGRVANYVGIFSDITERKAAEEEIHNLAFYDPLTGLPNRRLLLDRFGQALLASVRRKNYGAVLFLDLDRFKALNDTHGHEVGDQLLIEVAQRLLTCVRAEDTVARQGGDEFVVVLEELSGEEPVATGQAMEVAEKIRLTLDAPYMLQGQPHTSSPSIGVCLFNGAGETVNELLARADKAMYQAKAAGRNAVRLYDPSAPASGESEDARQQSRKSET
ncbi:MAG: diguanylate cyclase [Betaproteobacteria bacterium]|nr:diguanylate cyclase [Betaproteobacteria bacterium]